MFWWIVIAIVLAVIFIPNDMKKWWEIAKQKVKPVFDTLNQKKNEVEEKFKNSKKK